VFEIDARLLVPSNGYGLTAVRRFLVASDGVATSDRCRLLSYSGEPPLCGIREGSDFVIDPHNLAFAANSPARLQNYTILCLALATVIVATGPGFKATMSGGMRTSSGLTCSQ